MVIDDNKYVVCFKLDNQTTYFIGRNGKIHLLDENTTLADIENYAKQYSLHGAKCVNTKLWDGVSYCWFKGQKITMTSYQPLARIKKYGVNSLLLDFSLI